MFRNPRHFFAILPALALACSSAALATEGARTTFIIDQADGAAPTALTVKKHGDLLVVTGHASRTVKLESDISPADSVDAEVDKNYPLKAGAVLLGADERPGIYCAPLAPRGLGETAPCLVDSDMDGKFDKIGMASFNSGGGEAIMITVKNKFMPVQLKRFHPLSAPAAYSSVAYPTGQSGKLHLVWNSTFKASKPDSPVRIFFWLDGSAGFTGTGVLSESASIVFSGAPVPVTVAGISLRILGFGPAGELRCDLVGIEAHHPVVFRSRAAPRMIFIYVG